MAITGALPTADVGKPDLQWGSWGQGLLSGWWETTADLIWPQSVVTYGRMRHDPQLRGVLSAYMLPLLRATWAVDPAGCRDEVAAHVADDLGLPVLGIDPKPGPARRRGIVWHRHLRLALQHLIFGHMPFELRYRIDKAEPGGVHLDHLGQRMPWTIAYMHLNPDATIKEVVQITQDKPLPANRLLWYVTGQEGANWAGISMLRPAYGAWLLKHETWRVHATSIRRFGMGVPGVEAPAGASQQQVAQATQLASAMRVGDQAGVGLPQGFKPFLMGLTGSVPDALAFIEYLDRAMAKMALAGMIELGQTETGSRALGETFLDLFLLSLQAVADELATTATSGQEGMPGAVVDLVNVNWGEDEPAPRIVCTDVGQDYEVNAEAINRLVQFGAMAPDPALDDWIRKTWRLPKRETEWQPTSRGIPPAGEPAGPVPAPGEVPPGAQPSGGPGQTGLSPGTVPAPGGSPAKAVAAAVWVPRRGPSAVERRAGFDAAAHQQAWRGELAALENAYGPVIRAQRTALVDAVISNVDKGRVDKLGGLAAPVGDGPAVIAAHMTAAAQAAAQQIMDEAAHQGTQVVVDAVKIDTRRLSRVAAARAAVAAGYLASQAGTRALQVAAAAPAAEQAGSEVDRWLTGLRLSAITDQLGAALSAAQNAGRLAVLAAAPPAGYYASEAIDRNTCQPCYDVDGSEFLSLADADAAYPSGGYINCEGGLRCRGTIIGLWGG